MTTYYNKNLDQPYNQTRPLSQRTSGQELDEACEGHMGVEAGRMMGGMAGGKLPQAEAGMGMDIAVRKIDRK